MKNAIIPKKRVKTAVGIGLFFVCGILFDRFFLASTDATSAGSFGQVRQSAYASSTFQYIDPLLSCGVTEKIGTAEFAPLKKTISDLIDQKISAGKATSVSVYFDHRDGNWMSINADETYFPASLMKVPTMIAVLKVVESTPDFLNKKIVYDGSFDLNALEHFRPSHPLPPRQSYTVDELLTAMIAYSDNNAVSLLAQSLDPKILKEVFSDLGVTIPNGEETKLEDYMTVKKFATFFRVLHNATYLSREMSEKALGLLSRSDFSAGLVSGVPAGTAVSHKFGERNFGDNPNDATTEKELHDCGIVYAPRHPYLLCVMTKGTNFDNLAETISTISQKVFTLVTAVEH